jgi:hypothetical protein
MSNISNARIAHIRRHRRESITTRDVLIAIEELRRSQAEADERFNRERKLREEERERERKEREQKLEKERKEREQKREQERKIHEQKLKEELEARDRKFKEELEARKQKLKEDIEARDRKFKEELEARKQKFMEELKIGEQQRDKERAKERREWNKKFGEMTEKLGQLVEHLITPGIIRKFNAMNRGYTFRDLIRYRNIVDETGESIGEIDGLLKNGKYIMAIEVKTTLEDKDVFWHLKRLQTLRAYDKYNDVENLEILGAVAGAVVSDAARNVALKNGLYVIEQAGDTMEITSPEVVKTF